MKQLLMIILCCFLLSGCSEFHAYRPDIQQGNVLNETTVQQVHVGMDKLQVESLLGEPILQNTFDQNQLLYVYNFIPNRGKLIKKRLILTFSNNKLVKIEKSLI